MSDDKLCAAQQAASWSPDEFWQYVSGLAGDFEAGEMQRVLAERGLQLVCPPPQATALAIKLLQKITDLVDNEDAGEPLDDAIKWANEALAALNAIPAAGAQPAPYDRMKILSEVAEIIAAGVADDLASDEIADNVTLTVELALRGIPHAASPAAAASADPTHAMVIAGARSIGNTVRTENHMERARECWRAMTAAFASGAEEPIPQGNALSPAANATEFAAHMARLLYNDATLDDCTEEERKAWLSAAQALMSIYDIRRHQP